ncbi:hypothetical protein AVEN_163720-1 [Araneus ventricosus]|uniref:Tc1-like transposase DDE domain-containing protein n=1 Tax=Araneus ventricosus TaxID=182803 RepID=A0A4Y2I0H4_ARAVE|nr:hypothetical protein AVEN_163720-1 [Araneus ventricosus]
MGMGQFQTAGNILRETVQGLPRATTLAGDRYVGSRELTAAIGVMIFRQRKATGVQLVDDVLEKGGIYRMVWPGSSRDLNPIQRVWDALGSAIV